MTDAAWNITQGGFVVALLFIVLSLKGKHNLNIWVAFCATIALHQITIWLYPWYLAYMIDAFFLIPLFIFCTYTAAITGRKWPILLAICAIIWGALAVTGLYWATLFGTGYAKEMVNGPFWVFGIILALSPKTGSRINVKQYLSASRVLLWPARHNHMGDDKP